MNTILPDNNHAFIHKKTQDKTIASFHNFNNNKIIKIPNNNKLYINNKNLNYQIKSYFNKKVKHPIYSLNNISLNHLYIKKNKTERKIKKENSKNIIIKDKLLSKLKKNKLSKPPKINSYNILENTDLFPKEINKSKKYLRKIDLQLNSLLKTRNKTVNNIKSILSEDNRKINIHNLFNNCNMDIKNLKYQQFSSGNNKNKIFGENDNTFKNREYLNKKNLYNEIRKLRNKTLKNNYLKTILNNITRNVTYYNQKNNSDSSKKFINLLSEERHKLNKTMKYYNLNNQKKFKNNKLENKITITDYNSSYKNTKREKENNKHLINDYSDDSYSRENNNKNLIYYKLKTTMGDLNMENNEFEDNNLKKLKVNKLENLNCLIKKFITKQGKKNFKNFAQNEYSNYINAKVDTNIKEIIKFKNNNNKENDEINKITKFNDNYNDISISAKSSPDILSLRYRNKILTIFDTNYAPKKIVNKNNKYLNIIYLNFEGEDNVPCYENGKIIKDENILTQIYLMQKENEKNKNNKTILFQYNDYNKNCNYNSKKYKYNKNNDIISYLTEIKKNDNNNIISYLSEVKKDELKSNKKFLSKNFFNEDFSSESIDNFINKNINKNLNINKILRNNIYNKDFKIQGLRKKVEEENNKNNKNNKKKNIKEIYFEDEKENKELKEFLNRDEDSCLNKTIIDEKKDIKEENKFKNDIDKALLYLILFLKQKNTLT